MHFHFLIALTVLPNSNNGHNDAFSEMIFLFYLKNKRKTKENNNNVCISKSIKSVITCGG